MPQSVSNRSLKMVEEVRVPPESAGSSPFPVYIESRRITGYFPALEMKRLIAEREDLTYIGKVNRNVDQGEIPGFSFIREGAESLNEYIKIIEGAKK